jgi:hypothetical protein
VIVEIYRGLGHHDIPAGVWRWNGHFHRSHRGVVCQVDNQMITRMNVKGRVFQTFRCHKREQNSSICVRSGLVREIYGEEAIVAEESRRILDDAARGKASAGIGNKRNEGYRVALRQSRLESILQSHPVSSKGRPGPANSER